MILRRIALAFRTVPRSRGCEAPPAFAADCLETLKEIGVENALYFHAAGGEKFAALPCLNDSDEGIAVLEAIARKELAGWV
ncbi:MAG: ferrochelatase [Roseiarcus sp.]